MKVQLIQGPEGSPNFCFGLYDGFGDCIDFIQSDWDYAGLANKLGWVPCYCGHTDGTVNCDHRKTSEMLAEAFDYLSERDSQIFDLDD